MKDGVWGALTYAPLIASIASFIEKVYHPV